MFRLRSLNDEKTSLSAPAASAFELHEGLHRFFICPEILDAEHCVGLHDCREGEIAEIEAFGDDLRSDKDVYFLSAE